VNFYFLFLQTSNGLVVVEGFVVGIKFLY